MPELHFELRWPDGQQASYYSPSTTLREHIAVDTSYPLAEFVRRAREAMQHAAERVRAKYGYYCSSAMDTLQTIEATAARFEGEPEAEVRVLRID